MAQIELFTPAEHKKLEETKTPEEYQQIIEDAKQYVETEEALDKLGDKKTQFSIEEKLELLRTFNESKNWERGVIDTAKDAATQAVDTKKQELKNKFLEKIWEIPLVWGFLKDMFTWTEEAETAGKWDIWKKIAWFFGWMILWFFWYNELKNKLKWAETTSIGEEVAERATEVATNAWNLVGEVVWDVREWVEVSPKTKRELYYKIGINSILSLSWFTDDKNESWTVINKIQEETYLYLMDTTLSEVERKKILWNWYESTHLATLNNIIINLWNENTKTVLNSSLKSENIINIIKPDGKEFNPRLFKYFDLDSDEMKWKERLDMIYKQCENWSFDWKQLKLSEIWILYAESFSALILVWSELMWTLWLQLSELMDWSDNVHMNAIWEELKQRENELIPKNVIEAFWNAYGLSYFWWDGEMMKESKNATVRDNVLESLKKIPNNSEIDIKKLDELIIFKDYLIWEFVNDKRLIMDNEGLKKWFIDSLDYKKVMILYTVMWWNKLDKMPFWTLPILIWTIWHLMWKKWSESKALESQYLVNYIDKVTDTDQEIFTKEQIEVLKVYFRKIENLYITWQLNKLYRYTWVINHMNEDWMLTTTLLSAWIWANVVWGMILKNAIRRWSFSAIWLNIKRLWIIWIFAWIATIAAKFLNKNWNANISFYSDLEKAKTVEDIEKITQAFYDSSKSIEVKCENGKTERLVFVSYKDDTPYVLYNWKIWLFDVVDKNWQVNIWDVNLEMIDGKNVDMSKVRVDESNQNVTFWEGEDIYSIPFSLLVEKASKLNNFKNVDLSTTENILWFIQQSSKDLTKLISEKYSNWRTSLEFDILSLFGIEINKDKTNILYLPISSVDWWVSDNMLALIEIWNIKDKINVE